MLAECYQVLKRGSGDFQLSFRLLEQMLLLKEKILENLIFGGLSQEGAASLFMSPSLARAHSLGGAGGSEAGQYLADIKALYQRQVQLLESDKLSKKFSIYKKLIRIYYFQCNYQQAEEIALGPFQQVQQKLNGNQERRVRIDRFCETSIKHLQSALKKHIQDPSLLICELLSDLCTKFSIQNRRRFEEIDDIVYDLPKMEELVEELVLEIEAYKSKRLELLEKEQADLQQERIRFTLWLLLIKHKNAEPIQNLFYDFLKVNHINQQLLIIAMMALIYKNLGYYACAEQVSKILSNSLPRVQNAEVKNYYETNLQVMMVFLRLEQCQHGLTTLEQKKSPLGAPSSAPNLRHAYIQEIIKNVLALA